MRLSEAIRLGSTLRPQGFEALFSKRGDTVVSCAFGAALEAVGAVKVDDLSKDGVIRVVNVPYWLDVRLHEAQCPTCTATGTAALLVTHLNDAHRWDRLKIADWVETIENQLTQASLQALSQAVTEEEPCPA